MSPLTGVLREAWATYKTYAAHFLVIAFVLYLVAAAIAALLSATFGLAGSAAAFVIDLFGMFLLQAALVKAVQDVRDGRVDLDLRGTISAALPFVGCGRGGVDPRQHRHRDRVRLIIVPGLILLTFWSLIVPRSSSAEQAHRVVRPELADGPRLRLECVRHVRPGVPDLDRRRDRALGDLLRPARRLAQLHRRPGDRHPGDAVHRGRGHADLLPAHRRAHEPGPARYPPPPGYPPPGYPPSADYPPRPTDYPPPAV